MMYGAWQIYTLGDSSLSFFFSASPLEFRASYIDAYSCPNPYSPLKTSTRYIDTCINANAYTRA